MADPVHALVYKMLHAAESFGNNENKIATMNSDFSALLKSMETLYPRETLAKAVYDTIGQYNRSSANGLYLFDYHQGMSPEFKSFFNEVIAQDPNAKYLSGLNYGQERSIGILRILSTMKSDSSKQQLIDFINGNQKAIDIWSPTESLNNRMLAAAEVLKDPAKLNSIKAQLKGEPTQESVAEALKVYPGVVRDVAKTLPAGSMDQVPQPTYLLDALMNLKESNLKGELDVINTLTQKGIDPFSISQITKSKYLAGENRQGAFHDLTLAVNKLSAEQLSQFLYKYHKAINETQDYDGAQNKWIKISDEERPARIQSVMVEYGLK